MTVTRMRKFSPEILPLVTAHNSLHKQLGSLTDGGHTHSQTTTPIIESRVAFFNGPKLAELVSIVNTIDAANGVQTLLLQPDWPRKLQVRIINAGTAITAGTLDLVGIGARGQAVTQSVTLVGGTATRITTDAFAHVTSATVVGLVGGGAGQTISLGLGAALGLPGPKVLTPTTWAVFKANVDKLDETVGTVDATAGTVIPTTTQDGTKTYTFWYNFTYTPLNPTGGSSTTGITIAVGGTTKFHKDASEVVISSADATDLATSITLANEIRAVFFATLENFPGHISDTLVHLVADATNVVTAPVMTDLTTGETLANEMYTLYNLHLSQTGVHVNNDGTNTASSSSATTQNTLNLRLNDLKAKMNLHMADAFLGSSIRLEGM